MDNSIVPCLMKRPTSQKPFGSANFESSTPVIKESLEDSNVLAEGIGRDSLLNFHSETGIFVDSFERLNDEQQRLWETLGKPIIPLEYVAIIQYLQPFLVMIFLYKAKEGSPGIELDHLVQFVSPFIAYFLEGVPNYKK